MGGELGVAGVAGLVLVALGLLGLLPQPFHLGLGLLALRGQLLVVGQPCLQGIGEVAHGRLL